MDRDVANVMSSLSDIPVRVEGPRPRIADPGGLGGGVQALLHEILVLLERLCDAGEAGAIDLGGMPMVPGDRERLAEVLGEGEVEAVVNVGGMTRIRETGIAGVWWVEHRGADDEAVTEMIEVAQVPALLLSHRDDVAGSAEGLRQRLAAGNGAGGGSSE